MDKNFLKSFSIFLGLSFILVSYNHCVVQAPKKATNKALDFGAVLGGENSCDKPQRIDGANFSSGESFFNNVIVAEMDGKCTTCHNGSTATNTIYNYESMKVKLSDGSSIYDNAFKKKIGDDSVFHTGGSKWCDRCDTNICEYIDEWHGKEFANVDSGGGDSGGGDTGGGDTGGGDTGGGDTGGGDTGGGDTGASGYVGRITANENGTVSGWAGNTENVNENVYIIVYDGDRDNGGDNTDFVLADIVNQDSSISGSHGFEIAFSNDLVGDTAYLYIYTESGDVYPLQGSPIVIGSGVNSTQTLTGEQYYFANVRPKMTSCQGCHGTGGTYENVLNIDEYEQVKLKLNTRPGLQLLNGMNNVLRYKALGIPGHVGGNLCGSADSSPCSDFVEWYNFENP